MVVVGEYDNNVYVVRCKETGDGLLVDAANEHERLLDLCKALDVRSVIETHGHWDHIQAVPQIRDAGYRVAVTQADAGMLPSYDDILEDESVLEVGRLRIDTIATPGHTPGSMCFRVQGTPLLLSGDTLFPGGPGNTKLEGGRLPHDHAVARPAPLHLPRRHARAPGSRRIHDAWRRAPAPRRVGRARLVTRDNTVDALEAIFARRSIGRLKAPAPDEDDLDMILRAAAVAPDHDTLRPWKFVVLEGDGKDAFGVVLADAYRARCAAAGKEVVPAKEEKERTKLGRAPLVVVVCTINRHDDTIPFIEQFAAGAAAAQNILLSATALGYGSMWRTGDPVVRRISEERARAHRRRRRGRLHLSRHAL